MDDTSKTHLVHLKYSLMRKNKIVKTLDNFLVKDMLNVITSYTAFTLEITWIPKFIVYRRNYNIVQYCEGIGGQRIYCCN